VAVGVTGRKYECGACGFFDFDAAVVQAHLRDEHFDQMRAAADARRDEPGELSGMLEEYKKQIEREFAERASRQLRLMGDDEVDHDDPRVASAFFAAAQAVCHMGGAEDLT
jgi:hypothetical protein